MVTPPKSLEPPDSILKDRLALSQRQVRDQKDQLARLRSSLATKLYNASEPLWR